MTYSPNKTILDYCGKASIDYIQILYDTVVSRPNIELRETKILERRAIEQSKGYFVPDFFFADYMRNYSSVNLIRYRLPLLVAKEQVIKAFADRKTQYRFSYFGQIQSFRGGDALMACVRQLGMIIDVFPSRKIGENPSFILHPPASGDDLYRAVAESKFLIAFDNGAPFENYLPSKAFLYVSFTKPVIAFGENKDSALLRFFKDYPFFYYHKIGEPLDGLLQFMRTDFSDGFNEKIYDNYIGYSPAYALEPTDKQINKFFYSEKGEKQS